MSESRTGDCADLDSAFGGELIRACYNQRHAETGSSGGDLWIRHIRSLVLAPSS
jgi:hypothetical protein